MSVLFVNGTSERGGADTDLLGVCQGLSELGVQPIVALPALGPLSRAFVDARCTVHYLDSAPVKRVRGIADVVSLVARVATAVVTLLSLLRRLRPDIIHVNSATIPAAAWAGRLAGVPVVWHLREIELITRSRVFAMLLFASLRLCADRIVAISGAVRDTLPPDLRARTVVIHHGVDTATYCWPSPGTSARARFGLRDADRVIGFVGRLSPIKGIDVLIDALNILRENDHSTRLLIVGPELGYADHVAELRARVDRLSFGDHVVFAGEVAGGADLAQVYWAIDALVLPTLVPEGLGLVLLEALACGIPVVATNHGGPVEILRDCAAARMVPPGDPPALAAALADLLPRSRDLAPIAREYAVERFGLERPAAALHALYLEILVERA